MRFPLTTYKVEIILRESDMSSDDWHATVTRKNDGVQLIFIAQWRWLLKWRVRKKALDRAFSGYDKRRQAVEKGKECYEIP